MLLLLLVLNWVHPPIEAFIDYPKIVTNQEFSVKVSIQNYEKVVGKVILCLEKTCKTKQINRTLNFNFIPTNKSEMELTLTIKSRYKDLIIKKKIFKNIQEVKKKKVKYIKVLPLPPKKELIYDSNKERNKNISILILSFICLIISILVIWSKN